MLYFFRFSTALLFDVQAGLAANTPSGDAREIQSITGIGLLDFEPRECP